MTEKTITVAKDFSSFPFGRHKDISETSGEVFRDKYLIPALTSYDKVTVILDDARGLGSSFLEEAFGGIIRHSNLKYADLKNKLSIVYNTDPTIIKEIDNYMHEAKKQ